MAAENTRLTNSIDENSYNTASVNNIIDEFCGQSSQLSSSGWNEFREVIEGYKEKISSVSTSSSNLQSAINSLTQEVEACLGGYTGNIPIPSTIGNFNSELSYIEAMINNSQNYIAELRTQQYVNRLMASEDDRETYYIKVEVPSVTAQIAEEEERLANLRKYQDIINELFQLKQKYEGVFGELTATFKNLQSNI